MKTLRDELIELTSLVAVDTLETNYKRWRDMNYCLAAVRDDGYALRFVKHQTHEICLEAVQQDGFALQYVQQQTPALCIAAVKQNSKALRFVDVKLFE
jgi:hypothetical protein